MTSHKEISRPLGSAFPIWRLTARSSKQAGHRSAWRQCLAEERDAGSHPLGFLQPLAQS